MGIKGLRTPGDEKEVKLNLSVHFTYSGVFWVFCLRICSRDRPTVEWDAEFYFWSLQHIKRHMFTEDIILP